LPDIERTLGAKPNLDVADGGRADLRFFGAVDGLGDDGWQNLAEASE
jgi:hypothetical protein